MTWVNAPSGLSRSSWLAGDGDGSEAVRLWPLWSLIGRNGSDIDRSDRARVSTGAMATCEAMGLERRRYLSKMRHVAKQKRLRSRVKL